ncbi:MAG: SsrA-binding protein SmpB [Ruminococcaceae bacterium]|nr:SsrA-binding protein SmpB [Oscillospiraceae bacterium]
MEKIIAQNKKARHDYFVEETYEAGISLSGTEVKSIRGGNVSLKDSYATVRNGEIFVLGMHVSPYEKGNIFNKDPLRERKLLLHKNEIRRLHASVMQQSYALIPLDLHWSGSNVKLSLGLCKGKKLYDKRDTAAKRDAARNIDRAMKEQGR